MNIDKETLRLMWTGQGAEKKCTHLDQATDIDPKSEVCQACIAAGDTYPDMPPFNYPESSAAAQAKAVGWTCTNLEPCSAFQ